jgi:hypothetical protein
MDFAVAAPKNDWCDGPGAPECDTGYAKTSKMRVVLGGRRRHRICPGILAKLVDPLRVSVRQS